MLINSQIQLGKILKPYHVSIIKNEPMLFNCDFNSALLYCGIDSPTGEFLKNLPKEWKNNNTIIDSRVHMLMKGWYPCIPGFHHDDVPRDRADGQPEYDNPSYRSEHAMVLFNGDVCPTEFAVGETLFSDPKLHKIVYKQWHDEVDDYLKTNILKLEKAPNNQILFFNDRTWHQGNKAVGDGWRLFIRASRNTGRKATNELRKQVQVYLENPTEGW